MIREIFPLRRLRRRRMRKSPMWVILFWCGGTGAFFSRQYSPSSGTQLQYVTPEGIRHTLAMSDLDAGATQEMNEARGTTVQIHN